MGDPSGQVGFSSRWPEIPAHESLRPQILDGAVQDPGIAVQIERQVMGEGGLLCLTQLPANLDGEPAELLSLLLGLKMTQAARR